MAVRNMTRVRQNTENGGGAWFIDAVTVADTGESDIYLFPVMPSLSNIGVQLTGAGTGTIEFSFGTPDELEGGTASFTSWDGVSNVNPASTAWKVVSTGGSKTGRVVVKTTIA